jgi:hypothetical protein
MEKLQTGFGLDIGYIDHFQVVTTNNYYTVADFHTLQITTAHAKSSPACSVFTRRFLVTALTMAIPLLKSSLNGGSLPSAYSFSSCPPYNPYAGPE